MIKRAVVLFNLGGPDSLESVTPFLFNLFNDKAIINLPGVIRLFLAKVISTKRSKIAKKIYKQLGGKSPLLEQTYKQAKALEEGLKKTSLGPTKIFICMRYWHPMSKEVAQNIKEYEPDEILLLPLYPQFSTTTTGSSYSDWRKTVRKYRLTSATYFTCCYFREKNWIEAQSNLLRMELNAFENKVPFIVLFSAHGLPKEIVKSGDPYQWQIEETAKKIATKVDIDPSDWKTCYQSRVGPLKWIEPSLEEEIDNAAQQNKTIIVVPIAFVSEHSETLVELDIEYKKLAEENNCKNFKRVPALGTKQEFINSLKNSVIKSSLLEFGNNLFNLFIVFLFASIHKPCQSLSNK